MWCLTSVNLVLILRYISFLSPMELTFPFFTFSLQGLAFGIEEAFKEGKCIEGKNRHSGRINATTAVTLSRRRKVNPN